MSAEAIKNDQAVTQGPQIYADRKNIKSSQDDPKSSGGNPEDLMKEELEKILEMYEQSKAKIVEKLLSDANDSKADKSALSQTIALTQGPSARDAIADHTVMSKDIENFFMLIFKYLNADNQGQSKMQIAQAVNSESKENMINSVTQGMMSSLSDMKTQIKKAYDDQHSALGTFLKIVLPIVVTVICLAAALFTGGASMAGAAAADAALEGATIAATEATAEATTAATVADTSAAAAGSVCEQAAAGAADGANLLSKGADVAETAANEANTAAKAAEEAADEAERLADVAKNAVSENPGDSNAQNLANNVEQKAIQARTLANNARTSADFAKETATTMRTAATQAAENPANTAEIAQNADSAITQSATKADEAIKEVSTESFRGAVRGGRATQFANALKTNTAETLSNTFLSKGMLIGAGTAGGIGFGAYSAASSSINAQYTAKTSEATELEQGTMAVDSSASQGLQQSITVNTNSQQAELQLQEADESMMNTAIQKEASMYTVGSNNA